MQHAFFSSSETFASRSRHSVPKPFAVACGDRAQRPRRLPAPLSGRRSNLRSGIARNFQSRRGFRAAEIEPAWPSWSRVGLCSAPVAYKIGFAAAKYSNRRPTWLQHPRCARGKPFQKFRKLPRLRRVNRQFHQFFCMLERPDSAALALHRAARWATQRFWISFHAWV